MRRNTLPSFVIAMAAIALGSCGKQTQTGTPPYIVCPGDPSCPDEGEEALRAGAAAVAITPEVTEWMDVDADGDFTFEPRPLGDDTWNDADGDDEWDAVWLAGFGNGRPARGVRNDIEARALVLSWRSTTIAVVALDLVGYFHPDIEKTRASIRAAHPDIDFVSVSSLHNHNGPDTMGLWGFDETWPGWNQDYMDQVEEGIVAAVDEAYSGLERARVSYAATEVDDHEHGACNFVSDTRDPVIILNTMTILSFTAADDGSTISTLVNWGSHPEYTGEANDQLTADFPHFLREGIEEGVYRGTVAMDGVGGTTVYVSGAVGGLICPYDLDDLWGFEDLDGTVYTHTEAGMAEGAGWSLAAMALEAIAAGTAPEGECPLEVRSQVLEMAAENYGYHAMMLSHVFHRDDIHGYDSTRPAGPDNLPKLWTETSWLRIGRAQILGIPGEPTPEHFVGGYDGSFTPSCYEGFLDYDYLGWPTNPNPPDLSLAPSGPYLFDRLVANGAEYPMVFGLTNDEIGYLIPSYDFELANPGAYVTEPPGDHYEETNSIGPSAWPAIEATAEKLVGY